MSYKQNIPWRKIKTPPSGFYTLRVSPDHPFDFFWGKDPNDRFLLLLIISKDDCDYLIENPVKLKGISTDVKFLGDTGQHWFVLELNNKENADIFYHLCKDLIDCTMDIKERTIAIKLINSRLERWRFFLSKSRSNLLSDAEIQGLFSELLFIERCIENGVNEEELINGWQGPLDGPHDFVMGNHAAEIKSISTINKGTVRISSENQLFSHLDNLFLHVFFLAKHQNCSDGRSLNQIVDEIRRRLSAYVTKDNFDRRLAETGYIEVKYYDNPCFSPTNQTTYNITEKFPKITPDKLVNGLINVSYDLILNTIADYVCEFPFSGELEL